jgi:hypothetical protein
MTRRSYAVIRKSAKWAFVVVLASLSLWITALPSGAQSPAPNHHFGDSNPGYGFPSDGANAIVVEGAEVGCDFTVSQIEQSTAYWVAYGPTITELTVYGPCEGSVSYYENAMETIESYVESTDGSGVADRYWGGFMLDEEGGYGFSASQLETINNYAAGLMVSTGGISWYFTEDTPNSWALSSYTSIIGGSYPAPQTGSASMISDINSECSEYGNCTNMLTVDTCLSGSYGSESYVESHVNGSPWGDEGYWGSYNWWNEFTNGSSGGC